jgi:hypothetical protein
LPGKTFAGGGQRLISMLAARGGAGGRGRGGAVPASLSGARLFSTNLR